MDRITVNRASRISLIIYTEIRKWRKKKQLKINSKLAKKYSILQ